MVHDNGGQSKRVQDGFTMVDDIGMKEQLSGNNIVTLVGYAARNVSSGMYQL